MKVMRPFKILHSSFVFLLLCSCAQRHEQPAPVDYPEEHDSVAEEDDQIEVKALEPLDENNAVQEESFEKPLKKTKKEKDLLEENEKKEKPSEEIKVHKFSQKEVIPPNESPLIWPIKGKILKRFDDFFGRKEKVNGLEIQVAPNLRVKAAASGTVKAATSTPDWGKVVVIAHDEGRLSMYSSLKELSVKKGQMIKQGDVLGRTGKKSFCFRLYELKKGKKIPVDPLKFLP